MPKSQKKVQPSASDTEFPSAFSLLMPSWRAIMLNLVTFIELIAIPIMIQILGDVFARHSGALAPRLIFSVAGDLLGLILAPALIIVQLKSVRQETIDFLPAVREGFKYIWRFLGLTICMALLIVGGLILLIVPGIFMLRRYILAPYYLIDQDLKVFEALKKSAEQSKQFSKAVWGLLGVELVFIILAFILIGIVLSIMYYCAPALRYDQIKTATKKSSPKLKPDGKK